MENIYTNNIISNEMTSQIAIHGGKKLRGTVEIDGSKNSALVCVIAACLADEGVTILKNVPNISDIYVLKEILSEMGVECICKGDSVVIKGTISKSKISKALANQIRASIYCLGAAITTVGEVEIPLPGGDKIGDRPIDIHLECLESMGATCSIKGGVVHAKADLPLKGTELFLRYPSVGATCNIMLAASKAIGKTIIRNAAKEPEVCDLAVLMNKMGVKIVGAGSDTIIVHGTEQPLKGAFHEIIPDRIETGTLLIAIAMTGGEGTIKRCIPEHNAALISVLKKSGVQITADGSEINIKSKDQLMPVHVTAMPYPGLATDLQPLLTSFATQCIGESLLSDNVFPQRFSYVTELCKLGADITQVANQIIVKGKDELNGTYIEGNDIRSVTTLICAGLASKDITYVKGIYHLNRGHSKLIGKLMNLNAYIELS